MKNTAQSQQNKTFTLYLANNTAIGIITLQGFAGIPISPNQGDDFSPVSSGNPPYINPWVINDNESYKLVDANGGAYYNQDGGWIYPDTKGSVSYNLPDNKTTLTLKWDSSKNPMLQPSLTTANFTVSQSNNGSTYYITVEANTLEIEKGEKTLAQVENG